MGGRRWVPFGAMGWVLLAATAPLCAQQAGGGGRPVPPGGEVRGTVLADGVEAVPLQGAALALHLRVDSSLVAGSISGEGGRFRIVGVPSGAYYVRASFLGYAPSHVDVEVTPGSSVLDLGRLLLRMQALEVEGVAVTADASVARLEVDRTVFLARDLPSATGGRSTDLLRSVPSLEVDAEGRLSLRGNASVAVQVNGRAVPLQGDALANFLAQLPSGMVERVEVMQNPSARHDPEGLGGIVNLVLRQDVAPGLSGGLDLSAGTGDKYAASGNLGTQVGGLGLFASYGYTFDDRSHLENTFRENRTTHPLTFLSQDVEGRLRNRGQVLQLNADWKAGPNTVSGSVLVNRIANGAATGTLASVLDADLQESERFRRRAEQDLDLAMADLSLGWRRPLGEGAEIGTDVRYTSSADELSSRFDLLDPDAGSAVREVNDFRAGFEQLALQADHTRKLTEALRLEAGYRGTLRDISNDFASGIGLASSPSVELTLDNRFRYHEDIHAGYGVLTVSTGSFQLQGGMRVERTGTQMELTGSADTDAPTGSDYVTLYPSAAVLYTLDPQRQARLGYARRVQRPHYRQLNPFAVADDPRNVFVGNPALGAEHTHALELSLQRTWDAASLQVMPFFRRTTDPIRRFKTVDDDGVARTTFRNMDASDALGADVSGTFRIGGVRGMASLSGYRLDTEASSIQQGLGSETFVWNVRANASWQIADGTDAQISVFHRGPIDVEQGRVEGLTVTDLSVRHRLGERTRLSLRVSDPFDRMRMAFVTSDAAHWQSTHMKRESRIVYLGLTWSFGEAMRPRGRSPQEGTPDDLGIR